MGGKVTIENHKDGMKVKLYIQVVLVAINVL